MAKWLLSKCEPKAPRAACRFPQLPWAEAVGPEDDESQRDLPSHTVPSPALMQGAAYPQAAPELGNLGSGK